MAGTCMSIARLDDEAISRVRDLEREVGTPLLAVEGKCHWTQLSEDQLKKIREAEDELGVILLAYEAE